MKCNPKRAVDQIILSYSTETLLKWHSRTELLDVNGGPATEAVQAHALNETRISMPPHVPVLQKWDHLGIFYPIIRASPCIGQSARAQNFKITRTNFEWRSFGWSGNRFGKMCQHLSPSQLVG